MGNSRIDAVALFLALIAAVFTFGSLRPYTWTTAIVGVVILFVLFAYDPEGYRSGFQSLAFAATCGFALVLIASPILQLRTGNPDRVYQEYLPITWIAATIIFILIDRARMGSRAHVVAVPAPGRRPLGIATGYETPQAQPIPATPPAPARVAMQPEPPVPEHKPTYQPPPPPPQAEPPVLQPQPAYEPLVAASVPPVESPRAVPMPHGKEMEIYVSLVGEGLNLMRTVRAEHVGKDFYLITEPMPETESWQFTTGQIVRCAKRKLSHGKALVAVDEAPRAS